MPRSSMATLALLFACAACIPKPDDNRKDLDLPTDPKDPSYPDDPSTACVERGPPVTPRLRRLTFAQYDRTVSDLIGFEATPSAVLGPEVDGVTSVLWVGIQTAAAGVAEDARTRGIAALLPCAPVDDGSACAREFVTSFGLR